MYKLELVFDGIPISQSAARQDLHTWRNRIREIAEKNWPDKKSPTHAEIFIKIFYFYEHAPADTGDIKKPVLDALIGLAFNNYNQIRELDFEKFDLFGSYRVHRLTPILAESLSRDRGEFLYLEIEDRSTMEGQSETSPAARSGEITPSSAENLLSKPPPHPGSEHPSSKTGSPPSGLHHLEDIPPFLKDKHAPSSPREEFIAEEDSSNPADIESRTSDDHWWDELHPKGENPATPDRGDLSASDERSGFSGPVSEPADLNSTDEEENPS